MQDKSYEEYAGARRDMNELMAVTRMIEQKMHASLLKIQSVHDTQGELEAKSVGNLQVHLMNVRGNVKAEDVNVRVMLDPEDACKFSTDDDNILKWSGEENRFPAEFQFDNIVSREAKLRVTLEKEGEEDPIFETSVSVGALIKKPILETWIELSECEPAVESETKEEEPIVQEKDETATLEQEEPASEQETLSSEQEELVSEQATGLEQGSTTDIQVEKQESLEDGEISEKKRKASEISESILEDEVDTETLPETSLDSEETDEFTLASEPLETVEVSEPPAVYLKITLILSEVEQLAQSILLLSKQKKELDTARTVSEQRLLVTRTKYEQFQKRTSAASAAAAPTKGVEAAVAESLWKKSMQSFSGFFTAPRKEFLKNVTIFSLSVCLFHFQGEQFAV